MTGPKLTVTKRAKGSFGRKTEAEKGYHVVFNSTTTVYLNSCPSLSKSWWTKIPCTKHHQKS